MINKRIIIQVLGLLLIIEGVFLSLSFFVSLYFNQYDKFALGITALICIVSGIIIKLTTKKASKTINKRDGYIIVSLVWVVFSVFGALPFVISGAIPSYTDAFFETISGFTTTGASIVNDI